MRVRTLEEWKELERKARKEGRRKKVPKSQDEAAVEALWDSLEPPVPYAKLIPIWQRAVCAFARATPITDSPVQAWREMVVGPRWENLSDRWKATLHELFNRLRT